MKKLFGKFLCFIGQHDLEYLPSPKGIMSGLFGPYRCRRCPKKFDGFPYPDFPPPPWKKEKETKGDNMPGPVSDSYDPEFGTTTNAYDVKDALKEITFTIKDHLGPELKHIVDVVHNDKYIEHLFNLHFSERELRLIRFAINRTLEDI